MVLGALEGDEIYIGEEVLWVGWWIDLEEGRLVLDFICGKFIDVGVCDNNGRNN